MQLTKIVHQHLEKYLSPGSIAIDATAGNGYDTEKMAQLVGKDGQVIAIDIQTSAIHATNARLKTNKLSNYQLHEGDHASIIFNLHETYENSVSAITFNLGYLPGSDKAIRTNPESTLTALNSAALLLSAHGALFVTAYRAHEGGKKEADLVANWMKEKRATGFSVECFEPTGKTRIPPVLWICCRSS